MKISIITINFNNRVGLQRTIDSVVSQTCKEYEWIVIDGGSTDGSKELIEKYQRHFSYWCSEPDRGIYHAMNKGVTRSRGEYVNFMNSGDVFYAEDVLYRINELHSNADIISGQAIRMDNHKLLHPYRGGLFMQLYTRTISHQAAFVRRELLVKFPYDESFKIAADWKFWIQTIICNNACVEVTDIVVAIQDITGISCSEDLSIKLINESERERVLNEFFPILIKEELDNYSHFQKSPYALYINYLYRESEVLYGIGWKLLKCLAILHKKTHSILK